MCKAVTVLAACSALVLARPAAPQTLEAAADTYVSTTSPSNGTNGSAQILFITSPDNDNPLDGGPGSIAFLNFDLSSLPQGTVPLQLSQATLTVFVNHVYTAGAVQIQSPATNWSERTLNPSDLPQLDAAAGNPNFQVAVPDTFVTVDVTQQVRLWLADPSTNHGLALVAASPGLGIAIDSKENTATGHEARLQITLIPTSLLLVSANPGDKLAAEHDYTVPGIYTFTVPPGTTSISATVVGGGGGGCTCAAVGGGAGGQGGGVLTVVPGQSLTIVVGAGGPVNTSTSGQPPTGGSSSIGNFVAYGGQAGYLQYCTYDDCTQPTTITYNGVAYQPPANCLAGTYCPSPGAGGTASPGSTGQQGAPSGSGVGGGTGPGAGGSGGPSATPGQNGAVYLRW